MKKKAYLVSVAGASGSGKTTVVKEISNLINSFGVSSYSKIRLDDYYKDLSHLPKYKREEVNFDHPDSLDFKQLIMDLKSLIYDKKEIKLYTYDFTNHSKSKTEFQIIKPSSVIFIEGILLFTNEEIRKLSDLMIYVDTDLDICLARRIKRDVQTRGRDVLKILHQYFKTVKPMFEQFISPSKKYAHIIIPEGGHNAIAIDIIVNALHRYLH